MVGETALCFLCLSCPLLSLLSDGAENERTNVRSKAPRADAWQLRRLDAEGMRAQRVARCGGNGRAIHGHCVGSVPLLSLRAVGPSPAAHSVRRKPFPNLPSWRTGGWNERGPSLMPGLQGCRLVPVIGWQRHSPNVSRLVEFNPAVQRVLRIDIDNPSRSALIRHVNVYRDSCSRAQSNGG